MRMALGAQARNIIALVVREAVLLTAIGFVFGFAVSVAFVRFAGSQLEGIAMSNADGPLTWVVVSVVLVAVAQIASFVPARRAVRTDPVEALRNE